MKKWIVWLPMAALAWTTFSCTKDTLGGNSYTDKVDCSGNAPSYTSNVKNLLNASCAQSGCHNTASHESGVILDTYAGAKSSFLNGKALCTIYYDCTPMPQGAGQLSSSNLDLLTCWVKNGCPE